MQIGAYLHDKGPEWKQLISLFSFPSSHHVIKDLVMSGNAMKPQLSALHSSVNLGSHYVKSEMFSSFFFLHKLQMLEARLKSVVTAKSQQTTYRH